MTRLLRCVLPGGIFLIPEDHIRDYDYIDMCYGGDLTSIFGVRKRAKPLNTMTRGRADKICVYVKLSDDDELDDELEDELDDELEDESEDELEDMLDGELEGMFIPTDSPILSVLVPDYLITELVIDDNINFYFFADLHKDFEVYRIDPPSEKNVISFNK